MELKRMCVILFSGWLFNQVHYFSGVNLYRPTHPLADEKQGRCWPFSLHTSRENHVEMILENPESLRKANCTSKLWPKKWSNEPKSNKRLTIKVAIKSYYRLVIYFSKMAGRKLLHLIINGGKIRIGSFVKWSISERRRTIIFTAFDRHNCDV